jgi:UDP-glucuronate 4-epimerase
VSARVHLVTGAGGLVGRTVAAQLRDRGDYVIGIDRAASGEGDERIIDCDLRDIHRLHQLASNPNLDTIIHCGAHSGPMVARDNPHDLVAVNVVGTANVLEVARIRRLRRIVNCSSVSVYGSTVGGPVLMCSIASTSLPQSATSAIGRPSRLKRESCALPKPSKRRGSR